MKINIVRQDTLKFRQAQRIRQINAIVTFGSLTFFVLSVIFMSGQFVYLGFRSSSLTESLKTLQGLYSSRSRDVAEYLAVKQIIETADFIQSKRFKYKIFLDGVYKLLPSRAKLSAVDFGQTGIISVSVRLPSLADYDLLISNIDGSKSDQNFLFSAIAQKALQREKTGSYLIILELKIK